MRLPRFTRTRRLYGTHKDAIKMGLIVGLVMGNIAGYVQLSRLQGGLQSTANSISGVVQLLKTDNQDQTLVLCTIILNDRLELSGEDATKVEQICKDKIKEAQENGGISQDSTPPPATKPSPASTKPPVANTNPSHTATNPANGGQTLSPASPEPPTPTVEEVLVDAIIKAANGLRSLVQ